MAGTVKSAKIDNRTSRARLKPGRGHWRAIIPGRAHLGYQRKKPGDREGRWILRHYDKGAAKKWKYRIEPLGIADDLLEADGERVLSFDQAHAKAVIRLNAPKAKTSRITVRQAMQRYIEFKQSQGQSVDDVKSRGTVHILPSLGDRVVAELTAEELRRWLATMAAAPAQVRPKRGGKPQYRPAPEDDEAIRKRRATANRVLTMLKAVLNHAFDEGHVSNNDAWGRKLKRFRDVDAARIRYLTIAEAKRFLNGCDPEFRPLARAALVSGARYSELARLEVMDFNPDSGTIAVRKSKVHKARHIVLEDEGIAFFKECCAGRSGSEFIFSHFIVPRNTVAGAEEKKKPIKSRWKVAEQNRPMREANKRAKLNPPITFHGLRHTWASHATMNGVPLLIIGKNLGHTDTRMVEKHYGHLAPSFVADAIRAGAPKFGFKPGKVVPLSGARK